MRTRSTQHERVLLCRDAFAAYCRASLLRYWLVARADRRRVPTLACSHCANRRAYAATADDKIVENEEVAPRVTPVAALRRSRPCPRAHPLLRIDDPSPYAPWWRSLYDPTVLPTDSCYCCYQPQHAPEHIVASDTSLAGAQTTPPKTLLSSPHMKDFQKPPITSPFTRIPAPQNIPTLRKARFATSPRAGQSPARNQKTHPNPTPKRKPPPTQPQTASPRRTMTLSEPSESG